MKRPRFTDLHTSFTEGCLGAAIAYLVIVAVAYVFPLHVPRRVVFTLVTLAGCGVLVSQLTSRAS